jgi:antitoxin component YwqK of YwqJK toxin-antitoxin module
MLSQSRFSLKTCGVALVLAGLSLAVMLWFGHTGGRKIITETPRSSLFLQDGKLFEKGAPTPFTGIMVDYYPDGVIKSRSQVAAGQLHGLSEGWYTNGLLQVSETFQAGVSHGTRTKWHENGRKLSEAPIVHGQIQGTFRRWTDQGLLAEEVEMKQGQPDGLSLAFYPSGFIKAEAMMRAGEVLEQHFWKDGDRQSSTLVSASAPAK